MANKDSDGFFPAVYEVVRQIPRGRVISYGQIARLLGFPRAAQTGRLGDALLLG